MNDSNITRIGEYWFLPSVDGQGYDIHNENRLVGFSATWEGAYETIARLQSEDLKALKDRAERAEKRLKNLLLEIESTAKDYREFYEI